MCGKKIKEITYEAAFLYSIPPLQERERERAIDRFYQYNPKYLSRI